MMSLYLDLIKIKNKSEDTIINFLDSLEYCENGFNIIEIIKTMESDLDAEVIVIEGFKSKNVFDGKYDELYNQFRRIKITFDEFDIDSIPNIVENNKYYNMYCDDITIDKDYSLTVSFKDARNINNSSQGIVIVNNL